MSIFDTSYCGSIWHHGIKGQKWGVRRTPEELGHTSKGQAAVDKIDTVSTIYGDAYRSAKGFTVAKSKLTKYCLDPEKEHSKEFFDVGYKQTDAEKLFRDIESQFDLSRKCDSELSKKGREKFSIPVQLGITRQRLFRSVWQKDKSDSEPRFVSAYIDRRLKEEE